MTVLDSLFVGIFGICVVFILLVGLSLLLRVQSGLIAWFPKAKSGLIAWFSKAKPARALVQEASGTEQEPAASEPGPTAECAIPDDVREVIISPVPGSVLDMKVNIGAAVKCGDPLILLVARDMEYEINASADGTVTRIFTSCGAAVDAGMPLIVIQ